MFKQIIEKELGKEVEIIKRFSGGMSNYMFLIKVENELYTYRIPGEKSEVFIDRCIEKANLDKIVNLNLNCNNVYFNSSNGHKMAKYVEGVDLSNSTIDYDLVASKLLLLHNSNIKAVNNYDFLSRLSKYENLVKSENELYLELKRKWLKIYNDFNNVELVFCHGDAQKANWLMSNDLFLLDWEFSGNNDPYYDIACFGNKDFNNAIILLKHYLKREPSNNELKRLYFNRMYQCLQWYNVALYKDLIKLSEKLNVDFGVIAINYLKLANEFNDKIEKL